MDDKPEELDDGHLDDAAGGMTPTFRKKPPPAPPPSVPGPGGPIPIPYPNLG